MGGLDLQKDAPTGRRLTNYYVEGTKDCGIIKHVAEERCVEVDGGGSSLQAGDQWRELRKIILLITCLGTNESSTKSLSYLRNGLGFMSSLLVSSRLLSLLRHQPLLNSG